MEKKSYQAPDMSVLLVHEDVIYCSSDTDVPFGDEETDDLDWVN